MISRKITENLKNASFIRAMFEEGEKLRKQVGADKIYDFSLGNPDPEPPPAVKDALRKLVIRDEPGSHGYMSNAGYTAARAAVAGRLKKETGLELSPENVVMTCGAGGGLNVVFKTILNPGEEVIIFSPYFVEYEFYIDNHGGKPVVIPTEAGTFEPDADALEKAVGPMTKAVLVNSPNNPTGVVYSEKKLREIAAVLEKKEKEFGTTIYIVSDEPYREIVYDGLKAPNIFTIYKNSVIVYSYSKSLSLPGERIGYIAVNSGIADERLLVNGLIFCNRTLGYVNAPALFQKVITEAVDAVVDVNIYKERRDMLYNHLVKLGFSCVKPGGAFYLFPRTPIEDDVEFVRHGVKYGLLLVPGSGFGRGGHFRIAYCKSLDTIEKSLPAFEALAGEFK